MPMVWNSEADAKMMASIMRVRDIRLTGHELAEVALMMGDDCTAKAISHRMTHFRKIAAAAGPIDPSVAAGEAAEAAMSLPADGKAPLDVSAAVATSLPKRGRGRPPKNASSGTANGGKNGAGSKKENAITDTKRGRENASEAFDSGMDGEDGDDAGLGGKKVKTEEEGEDDAVAGAGFGDENGYE